MPFPSPGDLPDPGMGPVSPALAGRASALSPQGSPWSVQLHLSKQQRFKSGIPSTEMLLKSGDLTCRPALTSDCRLLFKKALETHIPVPEASRKPGAVKEGIVWAYQKPAARGTGKAGPRLLCSPVDPAREAP